MIEKIIILLFTELGFFLLCFILWKAVFKPVIYDIQKVFISLSGKIEKRLRVPISTGFIVKATIFANFLNYIFVIVGTSFSITCSWQTHFITFTTRFFIQKLEFLVKVFESLVPALETVWLEFLKFHNGVTSDIESFLHTFIASSNESDYTGAVIYILEFLKFSDVVRNHIGSLVHILIASSNKSGYTCAGIFVLLFIIFMYGCIWCCGVWSKIFTVGFELIGAPFEYVYALVNNLQHDEILGALAQDDPFRAFVLAHIRILENVHTDIVNLLVLFPLEQYSWFYIVVFFFIVLFYVKIAEFLFRYPVLIVLIIWAAGVGGWGV